MARLIHFHLGLELDLSLGHDGVNKADELIYRTRFEIDECWTENPPIRFQGKGSLPLGPSTPSVARETTKIDALLQEMTKGVPVAVWYSHTPFPDLQDCQFLDLQYT